MNKIYILIAWKTSKYFKFDGTLITVPPDKTQCTDREALDNGYWVGRDLDFSQDPTEIKRFIARHNWTDENKTPIAELDAEIGECKYVNTEETSQKCGIGSELMKLCLEDPWIKAGSIRRWTSNNDRKFTVWGDEEFRNKAGQYCESITFILCSPDVPTPTAVCKSYIKAAKVSGYEMMFIDGKFSPTYEVLMTEEAESLFTNDPNNFVTERGSHWFFCQCDEYEVANCYDLEKYEKTIGGKP